MSLSKSEFIEFLDSNGYVTQDCNTLYSWGSELVLMVSFPSLDEPGSIKMSDKSEFEGWWDCMPFVCEEWPESIEGLTSLLEGVKELIEEGKHLDLDLEKKECIDVSHLLTHMPRVRVRT